MGTKLNLLFFAVANFYMTLSNTIEAQLTTFVSPLKCIKSEYYNTISLSCESCPENSSSLNGFDCKCFDSHYFTLNSGGGVVQCAECPDGFVQSFDGFNCVICNEECKKCDLNGGFLTEFSQDGALLRDIDKSLIRKCVSCNSTDSVSSGGRCSNCKLNVFAEMSSVNISSEECENIQLKGGVFFINNANIPMIPNSFTANFVNNPESWLLKEYSISSYRTCRLPDKRNMTACQNIANMCILTMYKEEPSNAEIGTCRAYMDIKNNYKPLLNFPDLNYPSSYKSVYLSNGFEGKYIKMPRVNSDNAYMLAEYGLNGGLLSFEKSRLKKLRPFSTFSFEDVDEAKNLVGMSSISVKSLLDMYDGKETVFYELFFKVDENSTAILPLPVQIKDDPTIRKRFFLIDVISSKSSKDYKPLYIRYAKSVKIFYELLTNKQDGEMYPPIIQIEYDYISTKDLSAIVSFSFDLEYRMSIKKQTQAMWIALGVLMFIGLVTSCVRTWIWNKRAGKYACDLISVFKFATFFFPSIGTSFFAVFIFSSIYIFILFNTQLDSFIFLAMKSQEKIFTAHILTAFILKFIDVLITIFVQTSFDIFFIDWERSEDTLTQSSFDQVKENVKKSSKPDQIINNEIKNQNKVSCWRKLFVANEWNELQTLRKTSLIFQLLTTLFFLEFIGLEQLAIGDNNQISRVLRLGITSSIYLLVGIFQWIIYAFFYVRCIEDKIGNFIDFCSVSNISMFIMTHNQYGYYIHGRSSNGKAEVSMQGMIQALERENTNLTAKRGLEGGSNHQTFSLSMSYRLSKEFIRVVKSFDQSSVSKKASDNLQKFNDKMKEYYKLNRFLIAFIEQISRDITYVITKRNFLEDICNLEMRYPYKTSYFYKDEETCFTDALVLGCEQKFFIFELLCFLTIDYFFENFLLAAFVSYITNKLLMVLRSDLSKRNLARKTLVDRRFLI